jgi:predicted transcriptional regulator
MVAVSEVMTRVPVKLAPADSMQRAAELMHALDVSAIPVCDSNVLVGMVTDPGCPVSWRFTGEERTYGRERGVYTERQVLL